MGQWSNCSKGCSYGPASQLPLPNDHLLCYLGKAPILGYERMHINRSQTLAPVVTLAMIRDSILPILDKLVSDPIPNIRFNVAKSYAVIIGTLRDISTEGTIQQPKGGSAAKQGQEVIESQITPNLEKLQQDDDVDVRYFATIANGGAPGDAMETS